MPPTSDPARPAGQTAATLPHRTRLASLRRRTADAMERLFEIHWIWSLLFLATLAPLLAGPRLGGQVPALQAGTVSAEDIVAPVSQEFVDAASTREVRQAARDAVPPVYDIDPRFLDEAVTTVHRWFDEGRRMLSQAERPGAPERSRADSARALRETADALASRRIADYLVAVRFEEAAEQRLAKALRQVADHRIAGSGRTILVRLQRVTLHDKQSGRLWQEEGLHETLSLEEARNLALGTLREAGAGEREIAALVPFLPDLIVPNLTHDAVLTEARRDEVAARIEPLVVRIPRGKILVRGGETVTEEQARTLAAFNAARAAGASFTAVFGYLLLVVLLLFFMARYVFSYQKSFRSEKRLFALMVVVMALGLWLDRGFLWLFDTLSSSLRVAPFSDPLFYRYIVPVAAGSMLVTLLVNARVAMAFALFYVPLCGVLTEWDLPFVLFCLLSNLAGIYGLTAYRRRTALIRAGLVLGSVNALAVLTLQGIAMHPAPHLLMRMAGGMCGGVLVAVLVSFLLPVMEWLFNVLTDIRLLELSNLNNPLLRRLAVEAPGSYNHSVIVGTLAEAAAESIGANSLFCRVAAYYHDVGKMLKPSYFVENQREGANRHDKLSPHMSALVIASHVKEGYDLARSYGLPQQVLDIIPQHHGTRKINYFYQKAKKTEDPDLEEVRESDFRYPGPRPQTREAAIFMLSDSIEAAARTLEDPSPARFKGLIKKIASDVVLDGQFDECDLTFSDLEKSSAAFLRTLTSIYHHRVDYPGFEFEKIQERPFRGSRTHEEQPPRVKGWPG